MNGDPVVDLQSFTICADSVAERANVACCNMQGWNTDLIS
jgi:hypothetical protein